MEFKTHQKERPNRSNYSKTDLDIAYEYAKRAYKELGKLVKGLVLFGSSRTIEHVHKKSDIDILVVLDDITMDLGPEVLEAYKIISEKLVAQVSPRLHITTLKFTTFWDLVRNGDPVGINILREGHAIIDTGFFDPLQALLFQGKIKPTAESMHIYFSRAPRSLLSAENHLLQGVVDMYWAVIDATQAALMRIGEQPPSPKEAGKVVKEKLIKPGHLSKKFSGTVETFYNVAKKVMKREIKAISGKDYDHYFKDSSAYVDAVKEFIHSYKLK